MAAFYECSKCGSEFLGHDHIPDDDEIRPICDRCQYLYHCGICGDSFQPTVHITIDNVVFTGQTDYCPACCTRELMTLVEELGR